MSMYGCTDITCIFVFSQGIEWLIVFGLHLWSLTSPHMWLFTSPHWTIISLPPLFHCIFSISFVSRENEIFWKHSSNLIKVYVIIIYIYIKFSTALIINQVKALCELPSQECVYSIFFLHLKYFVCPQFFHFYSFVFFFMLLNTKLYCRWTESSFY